MIVVLSNAMFDAIKLFYNLVQMKLWHDAGSAKAYGREPKTGLGRVFNYKLGCIATPGRKCMVCMQPLLKL